MLNYLADKRAMTILEVIIAAMLVLIIIGAGITPYILQQDLLAKQFARNKLQDEISIALAYITRDAFKASVIALPTEGIPQGNQLSLNIPKTPVKGSAVSTVVYQLDPINVTDITRTIDGGEAVTIASDITSLSFTRNENNYLEITITGTNQSETITMGSGIALRATRPV